MENELKFSVGDIVEITKCKHYHEFDIGEVVIIKKKDEFTLDYLAENEVGESWWVTDEEIKNAAE